MTAQLFCKFRFGRKLLTLRFRIQIHHLYYTHVKVLMMLVMMVVMVVMLVVMMMVVLLF